MLRNTKRMYMDQHIFSVTRVFGPMLLALREDGEGGVQFPLKKCYVTLLHELK